MSPPAMTTRPASRRWCKFSLRSLFLLTALAAAFVGWVAHERDNSRRDLAIIGQLKAAGVNVRAYFKAPFCDPPKDYWKQPKTQSTWAAVSSAVLGEKLFELILDKPSPNKSLALSSFWEKDEPVDLALLAGLKNVERISITHYEVRN